MRVKIVVSVVGEHIHNQSLCENAAVLETENQIYDVQNIQQKMAILVYNAYIYTYIYHHHMNNIISKGIACIIKLKL